MTESTPTEPKAMELTPLVTVNQHNIALLFANYLNSQGISAEVHNSQQGFVVYCQPEHLAQAQTLFEQFIADPNHPKYQQSAWQQGQVTTIQDNGEAYASFKRQFLAHAGMVTLTIFGLCWLIFLLSYFGWAKSLYAQLQFFSELSLSALFTEPYRLLGPALFHFSWLHIVFNTMWWWQLGGDIEHKLGKGALINLFLASAIISNLGQFLVSGPLFGGLSGVVYGLVGYVWIYGWLAPDKGLQISRPIVGFLLVWMMLGFVELLPVNMANTAHLLGLITGCGLAFLKARA